MKIAIMGTGGVGGYYGGLLALHGQEVTFLARRGEHLQAIRKEGLQVYSLHGDFTVRPARATDTPAEVGPVDLVLVCTKTYSTEAVISSLQPLVGPQTVVVSLQNGIDAAERLGAALGKSHVLGGATWLSSAVAAPGVIRQVSQFRRVVIGELDGSVTPRVQAIADAFRPTGVTIEVSENISKILWTKFLFIAAVSGVGALTRLELGGFRHVPETRLLLAGMMHEVEALARLEGVGLDPDVVEQTLAFIDRSDPGIKPSMQRDVEQGCEFELESLVGVVGRKGRVLGVPTPIAEMLYAALLPVLLRAGEASRA
jgi:2-dehydropantoate 2-reductase